jgi:hypothetical protein
MISSFEILSAFSRIFSTLNILLKLDSFFSSPVKFKKSILYSHFSINGHISMTRELAILTKANYFFINMNVKSSGITSKGRE